MQRVGLVTGAGRGIGRAVAQRLSTEGVRVALLARNKDELADTAAACPNETMTITGDVTNETAIAGAFDEIEQAWGPVDVLVANAGAGHSARVERTTDEDWARILDVNLTAPFRCIRRAVPAMRDAGWGRIVVVASIAAQVGEPYLAAYTASKHGALGLVRAAAAELARTGVTVNAVCPAYVDTPMTEETVANIVAFTRRSEEQARTILAEKQPIGRLITPDEVADAVWFCISNAAVTGHALPVDGGAVP
jgi:NAD(P)-dependent dehydrogenase (short-subunit alcohol dehydrogenase family)